jgi:FkbH-like protein
MELVPQDKARTFLARWRALAAQHDGLRPLSVALCASFTIEPIVPYLGCFLAQRGLYPTFQIAPYNQIYQALYDPQVFTAPVQLTVVLPRLEELCGPELHRLATLEPDVVASARAACRAEVERLCQALSAYEARAGGMLLCGTLPPPVHTPLGPLDASHPASQGQLVAELNLRLWQHAQGAPRTRLYDLHAQVARHGSSRAYDDRMWYLSRCPFADEFLRQAAHDLSRAIAPLFSAPAKVVVLDLDHTLWGGIVGEDGPQGIRLGDSGVGAAFVAFQEALLHLRRQGVLLCLASKNNEADAFEVIDHHPAMRLRRQHLTAWRINWRPKAESIESLARELSLSLDSFVFIDDNPVECEQVRQLLPRVTVVQLPEDPAAYVAALRQVPTLDRMVLTAEDRMRAEQYAAERARRAEKAPGAERDPEALRAYLRSLELRLTVRRMGDADLPRVAQLTQKTNQFNLTTIRRTEAEVEALARDPAHRIYTASVADRFGDYGLTGVLIVRQRDAAAWEIDTLLLSCRVLGRGIETGILATVLEDLGRGAQRLYATFRPTAKNEPARSFLPTHGFESRGEEWVLLLPGPGYDLAHLQISPPAEEAA